ncbi:DUF973 family protein [Sulfurisphaera javensis]|uniref:DUF973 family protein n=1 Tax=Sulfurisphaera javensis TaxID=2049879 RepID=A0AAT9GMV3_9CREN
MNNLNTGLRSLNISSLTITISLILGVVVWYISLLFKIYPSINITVNGIPLSIFSPFVLSGIFIGILNFAAFYRMKIGLRQLNIASVLGASMNAIASVFLLMGNVAVLLSAFVSALNTITVLTWLAFEGLALIFGIVGSVMLGITIKKFGESFNNNAIKNGGILILSVILSYFGYILLFIGVSRALKTYNQSYNVQSYYYQPQYTVPQYGVQYNPNLPMSNLPNQQRVTINPQTQPQYPLSQPPKESMSYQRSQYIQGYQQNITQQPSQFTQNQMATQQPYTQSSYKQPKQQYPSSPQQSQYVNTTQVTPQQNLPTQQYNYASPSSNLSAEPSQISGSGVMKADGSIFLNIFSKKQLYIISVRFDSLPYPVTNMQPQMLQPGYNQVFVKFDQIVTMGLQPGKEYSVFLVLKTQNQYLPDQEIKIIYKPD